MRLWHYMMISYLPDSQLKAQKRECDLIWKDIKQGKKTNHILINYIWNYKDVEYRLSIYYAQLKKEFELRKFKFVDKSTGIKASWEYTEFSYCAFEEHNFSYLQQCYYNLQEKYERGQKDFDNKKYFRLTLLYDKMKEVYFEILGQTDDIKN